MRVVVPTSDGATVHLGHFGDARWYLVYELGPEGWRLVERRENPYTEDEEHEHVHGDEVKRGNIFSMIRDVDVLVAVAFGPGGREYMESRGLKVVMVKPRTRIEDALAAVARELGASGGSK